MKRHALAIAVAFALAAAGCGSHGATPTPTPARTAATPTPSPPARPAATATVTASPPAAAALDLRRAPYLGVSCERANSIACDRVRLAVWLRTPPQKLTATIDGRTFTLHPPEFRNGFWEGALRPAGMLSPGAELHVTPDRGRFYWQGGHPVEAAVHLSATTAAGTPAAADIVVTLHAGYG